jgi:hypothetical protein
MGLGDVDTVRSVVAAVILMQAAPLIKSHLAASGGLLFAWHLIKQLPGCSCVNRKVLDPPVCQGP